MDVLWGLLYIQGETGFNNSVSMEALKDQVQASSVRGHFTLHPRWALAVGPGGVEWGGMRGGVGVVSGSFRREGSFLWNSVHRIRWHSVGG